jgi:hypothetical protein
MQKRGLFRGKLTVEWGRKEDVYKDIIRIRDDCRGNLKAGRVHRFTTAHGSGSFILRGSDDTNDIGKILMDDASRNTLNLCPRKEYDFKIREVGFLGELWWACFAVDPTYRVAARLGVISFVLGLFAFAPLAWQVVTYAFAVIKRLSCG